MFSDQSSSVLALLAFVTQAKPLSKVLRRSSHAGDVTPLVDQLHDFGAGSLVVVNVAFPSQVAVFPCPCPSRLSPSMRCWWPVFVCTAGHCEA